MLLYKTASGAIVLHNNQWFQVNEPWNVLVNDNDLFATLDTLVSKLDPDESLSQLAEKPQKPIDDQEIWAAGVTYYRSRTARMEESQETGGGNFYDRVYEAERPEIFLKATAHRAVGFDEPMQLRSDSKWMVPEPELVLVITNSAQIIGYTVGNDLSCRDIEGENPLYLPQAKTFDRCAAVGPAILVSPNPLSASTAIRLEIHRNGSVVVEDQTSLEQMKREPEELVRFLYKHNQHPTGCLLMTGTGIVPPDDFTLQDNDIVEITIDGIGTLRNPMKV